MRLRSKTAHELQSPPQPPRARKEKRSYSFNSLNAAAILNQSRHGGPLSCSSASNQSKLQPGFTARCSRQSGWLTLHPVDATVNDIGIRGGRSESEGFSGRLRMPTMELSAWPLTCGTNRSCRQDCRTGAATADPSSSLLRRASPQCTLARGGPRPGAGAPARGPPLRETAASWPQAGNDPAWDLSAQPVPEIEFDQRIAW